MRPLQWRMTRTPRRGGSRGKGLRTFAKTAGGRCTGTAERRDTHRQHDKKGNRTTSGKAAQLAAWRRGGVRVGRQREVP
jgi:hypothetical protein